jgi:hypothetical protein
MNLGNALLAKTRYLLKGAFVVKNLDWISAEFTPRL